MTREYLGDSGSVWDMTLTEDGKGPLLSSTFHHKQNFLADAVVAKALDIPTVLTTMLNHARSCQESWYFLFKSSCPDTRF